jgi:hypothetical protein
LLVTDVYNVRGAADVEIDLGIRGRLGQAVGSAETAEHPAERALDAARRCAFLLAIVHLTLIRKFSPK